MGAAPVPRAPQGQLWLCHRWPSGLGTLPKGGPKGGPLGTDQAPEGSRSREKGGHLESPVWPATGCRLAQLPVHHTTPMLSALRCQQHGLRPEGDPGCLCGDIPRALPEAEGWASEHPSWLGPTQGPPAPALSHAAPGQANVRATQGWGTEPPADLQAGRVVETGPRSALSLGPSQRVGPGTGSALTMI